MRQAQALGHAREMRSERAFSLIEVLVVIAIIGVLIAIALPALSMARTMANQSQSLANLRTQAQVFDHYTQEYGTYPFGRSGLAHPPGASDPPVYTGFSIWMIDRHWATLMHDVAPWPEHYMTWLSPGADEERFRQAVSGQGGSNMSQPSYHYSLCFVGDPRLWRNPTDPDDSLIRATRPHQVQHPSAKVLLQDAEMAFVRPERRDRRARPVLLADGSASARRDGDAREPVQNPLTSSDARIYHDTPSGIHGMDF